MGLWWPAAGHTDDCPMVKVGLEARVGGRWFGVNSKGAETELGKVLIYDPYALFALDWQTGANMEFDAQLHSEVRVAFTAEGTKQTRVTLTHSNIERLGAGANSVDEGWDGIMKVYSDFVVNSFCTSISITARAEAVLRKIGEVDKWWGVTFEGSAANQGDHFVIRMGPEAWFHYTVAEKTDTKVVWHVDDCFMPWYADKTEWKGHDMIFEIGDSTLTFTHDGLVAGIACFKDCVPGWTHWITRSLAAYIETGTGDFKQR
jgi:hypothetical protein